MTPLLAAAIGLGVLCLAAVVLLLYAEKDRDKYLAHFTHLWEEHSRLRNAVGAVYHAGWWRRPGEGVKSAAGFKLWKELGQAAGIPADGRMRPFYDEAVRYEQENAVEWNRWVDRALTAEALNEELLEDIALLLEGPA